MPKIILMLSAALCALSAIMLSHTVELILGQFVRAVAKDETLAAWVQAIGGTVAILVAIAVANLEHKRSMTLVSAEDRRRAAERETQAMAVLLLILPDIIDLRVHVTRVRTHNQ